MAKIKTAIIFDLDDTLYKEIEYLKSAYRDIANKIAKENKIESDAVYDVMIALYHDRKNVFEEIIGFYKLSYTIEDLLKLYRNHKPNINLSEEVYNVLQFLKKRGVLLGLLTDGRSLQQRNKIKALGLEYFFDEVLISEEFGTEKPDEKNYMYFEQNMLAEAYWYVGDNLKKDFLTANKLGWKTIRVLDNGLNIHNHNSSNFDKYHHPDVTISELSSLIPIFKNEQ